MTTATFERPVVHPVLRSWRDNLSPTLMRMLAYLCGLAVLSILVARLFPSPPVIPVRDAVPTRSDWVEVERPFPAFALAIPEAGDAPSSYAIHRHATGQGRKDILGLGEANGAGPYLQVEIYRPGSESAAFGNPADEVLARAGDLKPDEAVRSDEELGSKFGPFAVVEFSTAQPPPRRCLGFVRAFDDPRLQISGWFCQAGEFVERSTLTCALDRLTLLAAGSDPRVGALFAQAELHRSFCGQRSPLLAPTPKHSALRGAIPNYAEPRRVSVNR